MKPPYAQAIFLVAAFAFTMLIVFSSLRDLPGVASQIASEQEEVIHTSCFGYSGTAELKLSGHIKLNKTFLQSKDIDLTASYRLAALHQLKYLPSYFNGRVYDSNIRNLVLSYEQPRIKIIKTTDTNYGSEIKIDGDENDNQKSDLYVSNAMKRGFTKINDPAVDISYEADFNTAICSKEKLSQNAVELELPIDPYLAYWSVNPQDRRQIEWHKARTLMNPCADSEYADIPNPNYYWYFWDPRISGHDAKNYAFDCRNLLDHKNQFYILHAKISNFKQAPSDYLYGDSLLNKKRVSATILFGWNNTQEDSEYQTNAVSKSIKKLIEDNSGLGSSNETVFIDHSSSAILQFITKLKNVVSINKSKVEEHSDFLVVTLEGQFIDSNKQIKLRLFWGPTDTLGTHPTRHWDILAGAFAKDDLIIYAGHSGLGMNLDFASAPNFQNLPPQENKNGPFEQVVAVLSCFSYTYFTPDLFAKMLSQQSVQRDFIYTGSSIELMGPASFELVRRLDDLSKTSKDLAENIGTDDFFVVKRYFSQMTRKN